MSAIDYVQKDLKMRFNMDMLYREKAKSNVTADAHFRKTNNRPVLNDAVSQFRKLGHCEVWMKDDETTFVVDGNDQDAQNVYLGVCVGVCDGVCKAASCPTPSRPRNTSFTHRPPLVL